MIGYAEYETALLGEMFMCGTPFETQAGVGTWATTRDKKQHREGASSS